jgi:CheY-like chemotaxis protein
MATQANGAKTAVVLLAEDSPAEQRLAQRALDEAQLQCDLRIVSDGKEVMDYLLRRGAYTDAQHAPRPDLILLDLNMPKLDGRQVLQQAKSNPQLETIPIVVLTTSTQEQDILQSYHLGCNSYIKKPVDVHKFIDVMRHLGLYWMQLVQLPPCEGN